jgi:hypothetical protein
VEINAELPAVEVAEPSLPKIDTNGHAPGAESGNTEDRPVAPAYADTESIAPVMGAIEGLRKELQKVPRNLHPEDRQHVREGLVRVTKDVAHYIEVLDAVASAALTNGAGEATPMAVSAKSDE